MNMAAKRSGLGKGLDALFDDNMIGNTAEGESENVTVVRLSDIEPDKSQPRKVFDAEALSALADSISRHGVLQPLVVRRPEGAENEEGGAVSRILRGKYRIVAGERRWRAAKMAGLTEVPVIVRSFTDKEAAAIMLVENLQREDLNPVEQAFGLDRLIREFELTQEDAAKAVGISRPALTNSLRLLSLPKTVLDLVQKGDLSAGHARALLGLESASDIEEAAGTVIKKELSVRDTEKLVKLIRREKAEQNETAQKSAKNTAESRSKAAYLREVESLASAGLGRKVRILSSAKKEGEGVLELHYHSSDDLEALLKSLCGDIVFPD